MVKLPVTPERFHGREADSEPRRACRNCRYDIAEIVRAEINTAETHCADNHENERNCDRAPPPGPHTENKEHAEQPVKQCRSHGMAARNDQRQCKQSVPPALPQKES